MVESLLLPGDYVSLTYSLEWVQYLAPGDLANHALVRSGRRVWEVPTAGIRRIESRDGFELGVMVYVKPLKELCPIIGFNPDRSFDVNREGWRYSAYLHQINRAPTPGTEIKCRFVLDGLSDDGTASGTITEILRD